MSGYPVTFVSSTNPALPFAKAATTCIGTVPVGTCTFTVTYTPTTTATSNGSFTVTSNALGSPQTVSLSGTGIRQVAFTAESGPGTLTSTITGGSLAFGNQNGLASNTLTITVNAAIPAPVTFGSLTVANNTGSAFSKGTDTCSGTTRAAGSTCTVTINFNGPGGNSARAGTLSVPHNGGISPTPLVLNLSGS